MVVDMAQFETGELKKIVLVLREKPFVSIQSLFDTNSKREGTHNFEHFKYSLVVQRSDAEQIYVKRLL